MSETAQTGEERPRRAPVAVVQSGDAYENRARVAPLAIALRDQGWDPVVLVDDVGAASLFLYENIACVSVAALGDAPTDEDAPDDFDPDDLCALVLRRRAPRVLADAEWATIVSRTRKLWRMLDDLAPQAVFAWNGHTGVWANALRTYKTAHGLAGGFMERGPAAGLLFVDPRGVNGHSSLAPGGRRAKPGDPEARFHDIPKGLRPPELTRRPPEGERAKTIFVPLQVQDDSNILLHSPRILRMRDLAGFAIRLRERLGKEWRVVLRPHPEETPGARLNLPQDPRVVVDDETPLDHFLDRAAICLTVNSNVGLLASLRGALVICLGEGTYCRRPFVLEAQHCDIGRLVGEVKERLEQPPHVRRARAFLDELASRALFWQGQDAALASAKLDSYGVPQAEHTGRPNASGLSGGVWVERGGAGFARAEAEIAALKAEGAEIVADFDFSPTDSLFLTYRRNREPLTREALATNASSALGLEVRLADTHRALDRQGRILMTHSRRTPDDVEGYDLVLDEFGLPHARTYLAPREPQP